MKIILLFLLGINFAHASGVLQLKGKVVAYSDKQITFEVRKNRLYIIDRTELAPEDSAKAKKLNTEMTLNVPMQAVITAKDVKANR